MKTLIIDNYDSFTYNLYQYLAELKANPVVALNDRINLRDVKKINPTHIVLSPGPGTVEKKEDFGICQQVILTYGKTIPLLGVCLGHEGIAYTFGGKIKQAPVIMHGKTSKIMHNNEGIFAGIPNPFRAMRYHSLCVSEKSFPRELKITARVPAEKTIMGIQHRQYPIFGIQFHPESFETQYGKDLLQNFLRIS